MKKGILILLGTILEVAFLSGCGRSTPGGDKPSVDPIDKTSSANSLQKVLDTIPKDSLPRADKDGELERIKANKWMLASLVGKTVEIPAVLGEVNVSPQESAYKVSVVFGEPFTRPEEALARAANMGRAGKVRSGGSQWPVLMVGGASWSKVDEAGVRRIRDLKGKMVTVGVTMEKEEPNGIYGLKNSHMAFQLIDSLLPVLNGPTLRIYISGESPVTIDGFDPGKK